MLLNKAAERSLIISGINRNSNPFTLNSLLNDAKNIAFVHQQQPSVGY